MQVVAVRDAAISRNLQVFGRSFAEQYGIAHAGV